MFQPTGTCPDYPVSNYSIVLHSNSTDIRWYELNAPADSGKIEIELGPEERIDENVQYSFSIMAVNSIGNVISNITECCKFYQTRYASTILALTFTLHCRYNRCARSSHINEW